MVSHFVEDISWNGFTGYMGFKYRPDMRVITHWCFASLMPWHQLLKLTNRYQTLSTTLKQMRVDYICVYSLICSHTKA